MGKQSRKKRERKIQNLDVQTGLKTVMKTNQDSGECHAHADNLREPVLKSDNILEKARILSNVINFEEKFINGRKKEIKEEIESGTGLGDAAKKTAEEIKSEETLRPSTVQVALVRKLENICTEKQKMDASNIDCMYIMNAHGKNEIDDAPFTRCQPKDANGHESSVKGIASRYYEAICNSSKEAPKINRIKIERSINFQEIMRIFEHN
ncbi:hypothetical protein ENBRE01_0180 [Enteropsectra breve]|nr:hypothetical protein ENBRE01_0180 [Enteropsectra breve]